MLHMGTKLGVVTLLAALLGTAAQAQDSCPDVRASQIDGKVLWVGQVVRCGVGFKLFGIGGGIFGPRCPEKKLYVPAHQSCLGEENVGTLCVPAGTLEVTSEDCRCARATVLGTGLLFASCECEHSPLVGGTVEDFETVRCPDTVEVQASSTSKPR